MTPGTKLQYRPLLAGYRQLFHEFYPQNNDINTRTTTELQHSVVIGLISCILSPMQDIITYYYLSYHVPMIPTSRK